MKRYLLVLEDGDMNLLKSWAALAGVSLKAYLLAAAAEKSGRGGVQARPVALRGGEAANAGA